MSLGELSANSIALHKALANASEKCLSFKKCVPRTARVPFTCSSPSYATCTRRGFKFTMSLAPRGQHGRYATPVVVPAKHDAPILLQAHDIPVEHRTHGHLQGNHPRTADHPQRVCCSPARHGHGLVGAEQGSLLHLKKHTPSERRQSSEAAIANRKLRFLLRTPLRVARPLAEHAPEQGARDARRRRRRAHAALPERARRPRLLGITLAGCA